MRLRRRGEELVFRGRPNLRIGSVDWPLFALFGAVGTGLAWLVIVIQTPSTRWAGLAWLAIGFTVYALYRKFYVRAPLRRSVRAPAFVLGPALELRYRTILVPVVRSAETEEALVAAARLAAERGATIAVLHVIEVPLDRPIDEVDPAREEEANDLLDEARALVESYGVRVVTRLARARRAGTAIVEDALARNAELIVLGASRRAARTRTPIFGRTVDFVLKASPCRVLLAAGRRAA